MTQTPFCGGIQQEAQTHRVEMRRTKRRTRLFSQLAYEWEYEGEDVHLGSEAITIYAV